MKLLVLFRGVSLCGAVFIGCFMCVNSGWFASSAEQYLAANVIEGSMGALGVTGLSTIMGHAPKVQDDSTLSEHRLDRSPVAVNVASARDVASPRDSSKRSKPRMYLHPTASQERDSKQLTAQPSAAGPTEM